MSTLPHSPHPGPFAMHAGAVTALSLAVALAALPAAFAQTSHPRGPDGPRRCATPHRTVRTDRRGPEHVGTRRRRPAWGRSGHGRCACP